MTQLTWLDDDRLDFPDVRSALTEPNGLLAVGGDLSPPRLIEAYRHGIFPWFDDEQPILWWSPDPRCVVIPADFEPSRSLTRTLRRQPYQVTADTSFVAVIEACRDRGKVQTGDDVNITSAETWITDEMVDAYCALHDLGVAHSVECWIDGELAGGLYGISLGRLFFGESMFHRQTDASKVAFAHTMNFLARENCPLVDCQVPNPHLESLGAKSMPRAAFQAMLDRYIDDKAIDWRRFSAT